MNRRLLILGATVLASIALVPVATAFGNGGDGGGVSQSVEAITALGTGFAYQGRLTDSGNPANGNYDLRFVLYDAEVGGSQAGQTVSLNNVPVTNGLFAVTLDFGSSTAATATATATATTSPSPTATATVAAANVWDGNARWIEIAVRAAGSGSYTILNPRQPVNPVPYALYAKAASGFAVPYSAAGATGGGSGVLDITGSGDGMAIAGRRTSTNPAIVAGAAGVYGFNAGNGAGVQGESTFASGVGVQGFGAGTSGTGGRFVGPTGVEIDGALKVSGTKTAFQVTANTATTGGNTCGTTNNVLILSNTLTDGDAAAMLIVTEVGTGVAAPAPVSVVYAPSGCATAATKWTITNASGFVTGQKFNVLVIKQ